MVDREDFEFNSHGTTCRAWFYPAQNGSMEHPVSGVPAIVMAHGPGGTRDTGLAPYAQAFSNAGLAVLIFDYRYFGSSDGQPRQNLSLRAQRADWRAAIRAMRRINGIDGDRLALWGPSLTGGHIVSVAAGDPRIAAIAAITPMLDGWAAIMGQLQRHGWWHTLHLVLASLTDNLTHLVGADPHYIPITTGQSQRALLPDHACRTGYSRIAGEQWDNRITPRALLPLIMYRPGNRLHKLHCPSLFQIGDDDHVIPPDSVSTLLAQYDAPITEKHYSLGHFDFYQGAGLRTISTDQIRFFKRVLRPGKPSRPTQS